MLIFHVARIFYMVKSTDVLSELEQQCLATRVPAENKHSDVALLKVCSSCGEAHSYRCIRCQNHFLFTCGQDYKRAIPMCIGCMYKDSDSHAVRSTKGDIPDSLATKWSTLCPPWQFVVIPVVAIVVLVVAVVIVVVGGVIPKRDYQFLYDGHMGQWVMPRKP